ncbi:MAG: hypothetical protein J5379_09795 [Clostridiales bacterium]|nr:hypothetical protein [Clostridiales bacterium]
MKRCIATLLTLAMVLSLMGCAKETEKTKKTKKTKKTTTEETSDTDDTGPSESTDIPSETETGSEPTDTKTPATQDTSDTSATADTSASDSSGSDTSATSSFYEPPAGPVSVTITDGEYQLGFYNAPTNRAYGELAPNIEYDVLISAEQYNDYYRLMSPDHDKLGEQLEAIFSEELQACKAIYSQASDELRDNINNATSSNYWNYSFAGVSSYGNFKRGDTKVTSFAVNRFSELKGEYETTTAYFNFDSATGEALKMDDFITDRNAFADAFLWYYVDAATVDDNGASVDWDHALSLAADTIRSGEDLPFLLYQNAIYVVLPYVPGTDPDTTYSVTFSALEMGDCVNLDYFTSTPSSYALSADSNNCFKWDFDGDGVLDTVTLDGGDDYYTVDLSIYFNGQSCATGDYSQCAQDAYDISWACMCKTDGGYYLYVEFGMEDPANTTAVFHFNNGKFEYVGEMDEFESYPWNPGECRVCSRSDLMGTGKKVRDCALGKDGLPYQLYDYIEESGIGVTKKKMTLGIFEDGSFTDEFVTIPEGTTVQILGIDSYYKIAYFTTLCEDESQNQRFNMIVYYDENCDAYDVYFDGDGAYNLFAGLEYFD